jgi:hypothetical protein
MPLEQLPMSAAQHADERSPGQFAPYLLGLGRFAHRIPTIIPVALFLGVAWLNFGAGLNIPATLWHEVAGGRWVTGVVNGASITLLFAYLWVVTYVLDTTFNQEVLAAAGREGRLTRFAARLYPYGSATPAPEAVRLRSYLVATFLPCLLLLALATVLRIGDRPPYAHFVTGDLYDWDSSRPLIQARWPVLLGIVVGLLILRLIHMVGSRLQERWSNLIGRFSILVRFTKTEDRWVRAVIEGVFVVQALAFLVCVLTSYRGWWYPPPVMAVCMFFALFAGLCAFVWYHARRVAVPVFVVAIVWVTLANAQPYKLRFSDLDYDNRVNLIDMEEPETAWHGRTPDEQAKQWTRVSELTKRRLGRLKVGSEGEKKLRSELEALLSRAGPAPTPAHYDELLAIYDRSLVQGIEDEKAVLETWAKAAPKGPTGKPKLIVVTVTGGANRSALWTTKVLHELHRDEKLAGFPHHVRLITGASGGMVGSAYYVGSLSDGGVLQPGFDPRDVAQDHVVPIASSLVFKEIPLYTVPVDSYTWDRGQALDRSLEGTGPHISDDVGERLKVAFGRSLGSLNAGEEAGWRPSLLFTPMMIEDGRRLIVSNRSLHYMTTAAGNMLTYEPDDTKPAPQAHPAPPPASPASPNSPGVAIGQERGTKQVALGPVNDPEGGTKANTTVAPGNKKFRDVYGRSGVEFFHLFPDARDRFRVSTTARMNATFPFVSPAVSLPTNPPRRVVDAGYYDNYGVGSAAAWLHFWRQWLVENTSGVLVIQIRDSASQYDRRHLARQDELQKLEDGRVTTKDSGSSPLEWFTGPLEAVDQSRQATSSCRNDELLAQLDAYFKRAVKRRADEKKMADDSEFFQTVVFERYTNVGMSWFLNEEDKRQLIDSWDGEKLPGGLRNENPKSLELLRKWWKNH